MKNDEYIKDKMELKENIAELIDAFNKKYDVMVSDIDIAYLVINNGYDYKMIKVNIETKL